MKKKSILALCLILSMALLLLSGCGGGTAGAETSQSAPAPESAEPDSQESAEATPAEEPVQETPADASVEEPEASETSVVEEPPAREPVTYPLCEPGELTFSIFTSAGGMGTSVETLDIYPSYQQAAEATGVTTTYSLAAAEATETKFNLMVASGDLPTFFTGLDMYYSSGRSACIEDGVAVDLKPYLETCAPDYMNYLDANEGMEKLITTDAGEIAFIAPRAATNYSGISIRKDWLDDLNLEVPQTYEELGAVLGAFKERYQCSDPILLGSKFCGDNNTLTAGYGLNMLRGNIGSLAFEAVDGKVELFCQGEGFQEYMSMMADWRSKGYFLNYMQVGPFNAGEYIGSDSCGVWMGNNSYFADNWAAANYTGAYDFEAIPMADVTKTPGEAVELGGLEITVDGEHSWAVTTACDDVEDAVRWLNWWYTEPGMLVANFGAEGEHYTLDADGTPVFTDLILANPNGYPIFIVLANTIGASTPAPRMAARDDPRNTMENEIQMSCKDVWYPANRGTAYVCYGDMTAEESEIYAAKANDIGTYLEEYMAKVIEGEEDIHATYDQMISVCKDLGMDEVVGVKQAAYDRFLMR